VLSDAVADDVPVKSPINVVAVGLTPSETAPLETLKSVLSKDAIPLLLDDASSPDTVTVPPTPDLTISIPSPGVNVKSPHDGTQIKSIKRATRYFFIFSLNLQ
jgi:hypothetical protein